MLHSLHLVQACNPKVHLRYVTISIEPSDLSTYENLGGLTLLLFRSFGRYCLTKTLFLTLCTSASLLASPGSSASRMVETCRFLDYSPACFNRLKMLDLTRLFSIVCRLKWIGDGCSILLHPSGFNFRPKLRG